MTEPVSSKPTTYCEYDDYGKCVHIEEVEVSRKPEIPPQTRIPDDLQGLYANAQRDSGQYYAHLTQGLIERIGVREGELELVDEALARRPAVADAPNRYTAICSAFEMASRAQKAEAMEKRWKFHYEKSESTVAQLRAEVEARNELLIEYRERCMYIDNCENPPMCCCDLCKRTDTLLARSQGAKEQGQ